MKNLGEVLRVCWQFVRWAARPSTVVSSLVVVATLMAMSRVLSGVELENDPSSPTLVSVDLLQALVFLLAWTIFVISVTAHVVAAWDTFGFSIEGLKRDVVADTRGRHEAYAEHQQVEQQLRQELQDISDKFSPTLQENEELKAQNDRLRKGLEGEQSPS